MISRRSLVSLVPGGIAAASVAPRAYGADVTPAQMAAIAEEAFIYGFPMVMNYGVWYEYFIDRLSPASKAPFNQLYNTARVYTPQDTTVVTPNNDTPCSFLCMDLRAAPFVVCNPEVEKGRYSRSSSSTCTPLTSPMPAPEPAPVLPAYRNRGGRGSAPRTLCQNRHRSRQTLLAGQADAGAEGAVRNGQQKRSRQNQAQCRDVRHRRKRLARRTKGFGTRQMLGGNRTLRAAAAMAGLDGNDAAEALYPLLSTASDGKKPDCGRDRNTLTFPPSKLPPANSFWSVTMYDAKTQLLVSGPLNRYLINSPMLPDMRRDRDGLLTIYIQNASPGPDKEANWLPAPAGPVYVVMWIYWPKEVALNGRWKPPPVRLA